MPLLPITADDASHLGSLLGLRPNVAARFDAETRADRVAHLRRGFPSYYFKPGTEMVLAATLALQFVTACTFVLYGNYRLERRVRRSYLVALQASLQSASLRIGLTPIPRTVTGLDGQAFSDGLGRVVPGAVRRLRRAAWCATPAPPRSGSFSSLSFEETNVTFPPRIAHCL